MTNEFKFSFNIDTSHLLPGYENPNHVRTTIYVSDGVLAPGEPRNREILLGKDDHFVKFKMIAPQQAGVPVWPCDASISFRIHPGTMNEQGEEVASYAGSVTLMLCKLMRTDASFVVPDIPLSVDTARDSKTGETPVKALLTLNVQRFEPSHQGVSIANYFCAPTPYSLIQENTERLINTIVNHMQRSELVFQKYGPTDPSCVNLRMPFFSPSDKLQLPAVVVVAPKAIPSGEKFWVNLMNIGARRYLAANNRLVSAPESSAWLSSSARSEGEILSVVAMALAAVNVGTSAYIGDGVYLPEAMALKRIQKRTNEQVQAESGKVGHKIMRHKSGWSKAQAPRYNQISMQMQIDRLKRDPVYVSAKSCLPIGTSPSPTLPMNQAVRRLDTEDFALGFMRLTACSHCGMTSGCDCEDGSINAGALGKEFITRTDFKDPLLLKLQNFTKHYTAVFNLAYVNGRQVSDGGKPADKGGHALLTLESRDYLGEQLGNFNKAKPVLEGLNRRSGVIPPEYRTKPVRVVETTGLSYPEQNQEHAIKAMSHSIYLGISKPESGLSTIRWMMPNPEGDNAFYYSMSHKIPVEFADKYSAIEHVCAVSWPNSEPTLGVSYKDYMTGHPNSTLIPVAPLTQEDISHYQSVLKHSVPLVAYEPPIRVVGEVRAQPSLNQLITKLDAMKRLPLCGTDGKVNVEVFTLYPRYDQLKSEKFVQSLGQLIQSKDGILSMCYEEENFSADHMGGYAVHLNIDGLKARAAFRQYVEEQQQHLKRMRK